MNPRFVAGWVVGHGLPRASMRVAARRGDLISQTVVDPVLREDPFGAYDQLRARGPIVAGPLISATASYPIANQVLRSDAFGVGAPGDELPPPLGRLLAATTGSRALGPIDPPSLLAVNPPEHTRYRRLVSKVFSARAVRGLEPRVREIAESLLDRVAGARQPDFDLVDEYAALLPVAVISEILGVPAGMGRQLLAWGNSAAVTLDPGLSWRQYRAADIALREMHAWLDDHVSAVRRDPGTDLLSQLAALDGADRLSAVELRATALLVLGAGFETTVNLIGNAVVHLLTHPDQLASLRAHPDGWDNAVEEVLRYDSPVQVTLRQAVTDTELAGAPVPAGRGVLIMLGGANRDPDVFDDPHRFDVTRANAGDHLAFSAGTHFCLGASLARIEAVTALTALFDRFDDLDLAGPPTRRDTRVLRGYTRLPVTSTGRRSRTAAGGAHGPATARPSGLRPG